MSKKMLKLARKDVMMHLNFLFELHNGQSDDKFTLVDTGGEMCVFTLKGAAYPIRISDYGEVWTFGRSLKDDTDAERYAKLCYDTLLKRSNEITDYAEYPTDELIDPTYKTDLTKMGLNPDISLEDYRNFIKYMFASKQTCAECKVGIVHVEINSWSEEHTCMNCDKGDQVC